MCSIAKRFAGALSEEESSKRIRNAVPKSTQYKTQWGVRIFEAWRNERANEDGSAESCDFDLDVSVVERLKTDLLLMTPETLNFWLSKFVQEVRDREGKTYPEKTVYQLICCIKRYYEENGKAEMNPLNKENYKFQVFRKVLDAEMKSLHARVSQDHARKDAKADREAITVEEEKQMWSKGVLGESSPETLLQTLYFYIGKLFGLRASEHRTLRLDNFVVSENEVLFVENVSKTYHGGLKDLKRKRRNVKHYCHTENEKEHNPCIVKMFKKYMSMVSQLSRRDDAFYFRPSKTCYKFEDFPVGIHKLNSILPSLTAAAGLERKTAHSLRVTCASTLFQNNVEEKLIRERTGHISNALFKYEKPSKEQSKCVSDCLGPPLPAKQSDVNPSNELDKPNDQFCFDDDLDEFFAGLNYEELCVSKDNNSEASSGNVSLENIFCNSDLSNATVNINVNFRK